MLKQSMGDLVVQARLQQHDTLASLHPESLNTLKMLSTRKDGEASRISSLLRVGAGGGFTDNGAAGGLCCAVEPDGQLRGPWLDTLLRAFDTHPTTGAAFDIQVPGIAAACELVGRMHERLPYFNIATFDIAISPDAERKPLQKRRDLSFAYRTSRAIGNHGATEFGPSVGVRSRSFCPWRARLCRAMIRFTRPTPG